MNITSTTTAGTRCDVMLRIQNCIVQEAGRSWLCSYVHQIYFTFYSQCACVYTRTHYNTAVRLRSNQCKLGCEQDFMTKKRGKNSNTLSWFYIILLPSKLCMQNSTHQLVVGAQQSAIHLERVSTLEKPTAKRKQKKKHGENIMCENQTLAKLEHDITSIHHTPKWSDMKSSTPCHYVLQVPKPSSHGINCLQEVRPLFALM